MSTPASPPAVDRNFQKTLVDEMSRAASVCESRPPWHTHHFPGEHCWLAPQGLGWLLWVSSRRVVMTRPATAAPGDRCVSGPLPDQDPEKLNRLYGLVATYLGSALDVEVEFVPVTEYSAVVSLFRAGDLDLVWLAG